MEVFSVQHGGALTVKHHVLLDFAPGAVQIARELQKIAAIVIVGWVAVTSIKSFSSRGTKSN